MASDPRPHIVHLVYRFAVGGLENGVVNLINRMPADRWRHTVVSLTSVDAAFAARLKRPDVRCLALGKPAGQGLWLYPRLWRLFRELRPDIVHTRNLAALEFQVPALAAGVHGRVHGEHGRDVEDMDGTSRKHIWMRRIYRPFVKRYIALSGDLEGYLRQSVQVPKARIAHICNGVDSERFHPAPQGRAAVEGSPFNAPGLFVIGTVGRMMTVKAQPDLAAAFVRALQQQPQLRATLRLVMVGDGPLRTEAERILQQGGAADLAWLPGERADVPDVMRGLDCFVLPSLAEGISNTILEAMACGLPVLATAVGGNAELVDAGVTGQLVPAGDVEALAEGIIRLAMDPAAARASGQAARRRVEARFSLAAMVSAYENVYRELLPPSRPVQPT